MSSTIGAGPPLVALSPPAAGLALSLRGHRAAQPQPEEPWAVRHLLPLVAAPAAVFLLTARSQRQRRGAARRCRPLQLQAVPKAASWTAGQQNPQVFASEEEYLAHLESKAKLPAGFKVGNTQLKFVPREVPQMGELPMRLTVIAMDEPTPDYAAVFTRNAFPGAPVRVGRRRLAGGQPLQAICVNNKVSNVLPSDGGEEASEKVCAAVAAALGLKAGASSVLPSSTGVIGWCLPADELAAAAPGAVAALQSKSALPGAQGIMTTDRFPKLSSVELPGGARLVGFSKGAGMIEPNMATMLCYLLTDAQVPGGKATLQEALSEAVKATFNCISVDGDESTSDTAVLLSSGKVPCTDVAAFKAALLEVCGDLASLMVHNGEGTEHVIRVKVEGAVSDIAARDLGRAVVNGPLFKSAVAGNDPNVGRLVAKVGQTLGALGQQALAEGTVCKIGGEAIFEHGRFALDSEKEKRLSAHMKDAKADSSLKYPPHRRVVDVEVYLGGGGSGKAVVLGSDLTKEYVEINADYRS